MDPTDKAISKIAYTLNFKKFEINYLKKKDYDYLIEMIAPPTNEFLKMIEESDEEIVVDHDEAQVDEEELDAEINKSALS